MLESSINTLQSEWETAQAITLLIQGAAVTQVGLRHFKVQALLYDHYKYRKKTQMQTGVESLAHEKLQTSCSPLMPGWSRALVNLGIIAPDP